MRNLLFLLFSVLMLSGCRSLSPNRMFQTPKDYEFVSDSAQQTRSTAYIIQSYDKVELHIFSNDGFKLVDITQNTMNSTSQYDNYTYVVDDSGNVKFPVIGYVTLRGMTVNDAQNMLEKRYSKYYNDPFVLLRITNRHVLVFQADNGHGMLVNLQNDNTSLFEALALAGGISENGKSYKIKIIRGDLHNPKIYQADVYSVEGLKNSELKVLSNDIIYVEASANYKQRILQQITPLVGIITAVLLVLNIVKK